jgi:hypothetical protein
MTTITWLIEQMWVKPQEDNQTDVVVTAAWRCNGTDGTYNGTVYGTASFTLEQGGSFTPYADLTENQVLGWCYANGVDQIVVETNVITQIDNQVNPPIITPPLPWGTQAT